MSNIPELPSSTAGARYILKIIMILSTIIFIITFSVWAVDASILARHGQPDLNDLTQDQVVNKMFVKGTVDKAYGPFAKQYHGVTKDIPSVLDHYYYLVPIYNDEGFIEFFITISSKFFDGLGSISKKTMGEETQNYKEIYIEYGRMYKLDSEERRVLNAWLELSEEYNGDNFITYLAKNNLMGTDDEELIKSKIAPFIVHHKYRVKRKPGGFIVTGIISIVCLLLIIFLKDTDKKNLEMYQRRYEEMVNMKFEK